MLQYVVIAGYYNNETNIDGMIQAVGVYDNAEQAYGAAFLHLCKSAEDLKDETVTISTPYRLEGESGFGMDMKHGIWTEYAYVLFCDPDTEN